MIIVSTSWIENGIIPGICKKLIRDLISIKYMNPG